MRFWFEKFRKGDMRDMEHQRQIIDTFVNSVYVFDDRVVLNFNFTDDSKTISREEVLGSSAVENAPPQKSSDFRLRIFCLWWAVQDSKARPCHRRGKKQSSGLFFSAWLGESRNVYRDDCGSVGGTGLEQQRPSS